MPLAFAEPAAPGPVAATAATAAAARLAALVLIVIALPAGPAGCNRGPCDSPREVITAFLTSLEEDDRENAFKLLDPESRRKLTETARLAGEKSGKKIEPYELIVSQRFQAAGNIVKIGAVRQEKGGRSSVEIGFKDGTSTRMPLSREGNCYKIHLEI